MKVILASLVILLASFTATVGYILGAASKVPMTATASTAQSHFSPTVEKIINNKLKLLNEVATDKTVITTVKKTNADHKDLTQALINQMDQNWRVSSSDSANIKAYQTNQAALVLLKFQANHPNFTEIFMTDNRGLNAAETNKTSDFNQADEDWWVKSFNGGKGKVWHSDLEFDESSQTEGISLYLPVLDTESNKVIGVIKAELSLNEVKLEL